MYSYCYFQKEYRKSELYKQEVNIAKGYLAKQEHINDSLDSCPVCKKGQQKVFFKKWDITYYRCASCFSVFAGIKNEIAEQYESSPELIDFYCSEDYQRQGEIARENRWEEIVDWISYRTLRYSRRNRDLFVVDYGNRWKGFRKRIESSSFSSKYVSVFPPECEEDIEDNSADIVMAFDYIQRKINPESFFRKAYDILSKNGLLFLGLKSGSGMDILLLKDNNTSVFPPEHVIMPSKEGIYMLLEKVGFEVLEYTTPGMFDVNFVKDNMESLPEEEYFMRYLLSKDNTTIDGEFQRFIQKAGMSSYAQIVARKR